MKFVLYNIIIYSTMIFIGFSNNEELKERVKIKDFSILKNSLTVEIVADGNSLIDFCDVSTRNRIAKAIDDQIHEQMNYRVFIFSLIILSIVIVICFYLIIIRKR
jgi:hypothetical protein